MHRVFISLIFCFFSISTMAQAESLDVAGVWLTPKKTSKVQISDCGDGHPCGKIVWIDPQTEGSKTDNKNPDETLRNQPLIGLTILKGFTWKKNQWGAGKIYDPKDGRTYGSRLRLNEDGTLRVKGCIGPICKTQTWTASTFNEAS